MNSLTRARLENSALALLALLASTAVFISAESVTTSERLSRRHQLLEVFKPEDVTRIALESEHGKVSIKRKVEQASSDEREPDRAWRFENDLAEPAEADRVDRLLQSLQYANFERKLTPPIDRHELGFDTAFKVLHLDSGAIHYRLRIGKPAEAPKGAHYLEVTGENVPRSGSYVVSKRVVEDLSVDAADFRGRLLIPVLTSEMAGLSLTRLGSVTPALELSHRANVWYVVGKGDKRAARRQMEHLLASLARFEADPFLESGEAARLTEGGSELRLSLAGDSPEVRLLIGRACPNDPERIAVARIAPTPLAGCVPVSATRSLDVESEAYLDDRAFSLTQDEVELLHIEETGEKPPRVLELVREGAGFKLRKPVAADVDADLGEARLSAVLEIRGELVERPASLALDRKVGSVSVRETGSNGDDAKGEQISVFDAPGKNFVYLQRQQDNAVLKLTREASLVLSFDTTLLKSRRILDFKPADFQSLEVSSKGFVQRFERQQNGNYELTSPAGFIADATLASEIIDALRSLETPRWVSESSDRAYGLETPTLTALVTYAAAGSVKQRKLSVGNRALGGYYASVGSIKNHTVPIGVDSNDEPGVFLLPREVVDELSTLILDRGSFSADVSSLRRVTLTSGTASLALERQAGTLQPLEPATLEPHQLQDVVAALEALRPECAIHVGAALAHEGFTRPSLVLTLEDVEPPARRVIQIGARDTWRNTSINYARLQGSDATYVIAHSMLKPLLDLF